MIEKSKISTSGKITYSMESIESCFLASYINAISEALKIEKVLEEISSELEINKDDLKNLNGYDTIHKWVNLF